MKKKKLAWAVLPAIAAMALVACNKTNPDPTTSDTPSSINSDGSQTSGDGQHAAVIGSFNREAAEGDAVRAFDERFDVRVEDFSGESLNGTTTGVRHEGYAKAIVDSLSPNFQNSTNNAIYKAASGSYEGMNLGANGIGFKMRIAKGSIKLSDLQLELRGADNRVKPGETTPTNLSTYKIGLDEACNGDGEANPELSEEWQDIIINPGQTIEDENAVYSYVDGDLSDLNVLGTIIGFHLTAKEGIDVSAIIEIDEVFTFTGTNRTILDNFNRDNLNKVPDAWWGGSDSNDVILVRPGLNINGKEYVTPSLEAGKNALVISALGDTSGTRVTSLTSGGEIIKSLPFNELKAREGKVGAAVNGAYADLAFNLAELGEEGITIDKVKIESTTDLEISNVFATSYEMPVLDLEYPHIDGGNATSFDNFDRNISSLNSDWEASNALPANVDAGINGIVSYHRGDEIYLNGQLHLPAAPDADNYAQVTIGTTHMLEGAKYLVFSVKGEGLGNLRWQLGSQDFVYFNSGLAAEGVKAYGDPAFPTPYADGDFKWYVFDLAANGIVANDTINIYYNGENAIEIDTIFWARNPMLATRTATGQDFAQVGLDLAEWHYCGGIAINGRYFGVKVRGDGVSSTTDSIRYTYDDGTAFWIKDGAVAYWSDGAPLLPGEVLPVEYVTIWFDLLANDPEYTPQTVHLHVGGGALGTLSVEYAFPGDDMYGVEINDQGEKAVPASDYAYLGGVNPVAFSPDYIGLTIVGDNILTFETFRIELGGKVVYANAGLVITNIETGEPVTASTVIPSSGLNIAIDMKASGYTDEAGELAFHFGGWNPAAGTVHITSGAYWVTKLPYSVAVEQFSPDWGY